MIPKLNTKRDYKRWRLQVERDSAESLKAHWRRKARRRLKRAIVRQIPKTMIALLEAL